MKKLLIFIIPVLMLFAFSPSAYAGDEHTSTSHDTEEVKKDGDTTKAAAHAKDAHATGDHKAGEDHGHHGPPPVWTTIPFVLLLLMIATGPLFFEHFWHKRYPIVAVTLGAIVTGYYIFAYHDGDSVIHTLAEYVQFIALLTGLFMSAGGILIKVDKKGKPMTNMILLIIGAVLSNFIGTTGASMLLIRPFIRLNKDRIKAYHVVFFIFIVSNVGGSLTPIGDPPLFLGFLKGVPFTWTLTHDLLPWLFAITLLSIVFFLVDSRNKSDETTVENYTGKVTIKGSKNFFWIFLIIGAVFLDPNVFEWVPSIKLVLHGHLTKISFIREGIMLACAFLSYYFSDEEALKGNEFDFEPIKEVAFIFIGIFFTMMPALANVAAYAKANPDMINIHSLYWLTGSLSGVLDNAPTYVNFLTAALASNGGSIQSMADVKSFSEVGNSVFATGANYDAMKGVVELTAISIASVFFGAMTYIGNAPNFMVKAIAEQSGIQMPSFFSYIAKYSLIILLPILTIVWVVFVLLGGIEWSVNFFHL